MPRDLPPSFTDRLLQARPSFFWWTLILIASSLIAYLSWSLCIAIFNSPEIPHNYSVLQRLGRTPKFESYTTQNAPKLPALESQSVRSNYFHFSKNDLQLLNAQLLHNYLTNYSKPLLSSYIEGDFRLISKRPLQPKDFIKKGFALQLQAVFTPDTTLPPRPYPVIVEILFSTPYTQSLHDYHIGDTITLKHASYFASLLHVSRHVSPQGETLLIATAISLAPRMRPTHGGFFDLQAPRHITIQAPFPLFSPPQSPTELP